MEYKIVYSLEELPNFNKEMPIFCDIETDDLYGPLRMIQMYQPPHNVFIYDLAPIGYNKQSYPYAYQALKDYLLQYHTVWYNASYDLGTMNIAPDRVDDLFYAVRLAYPEFMEFGLKSIVKKLRYTQDMYKGINTDDASKGFVLGSYISKQAYDYASKDVYTLSLIWEDKKIQHVINNSLAYKVDMISQHYALQYQQNGLLLDRSMWETELVKASKDVDTYSKLLPPGFNPNSFKQVRALLNIESSDHEALITIALSDGPNNTNADAIIKLKRALKQVSYLKSINFDRMYTKFNVAGAVSGRFTSTGGSLQDHFNSQQIPRNYQKLFNQPTEDTVVIDADYSTLELRLAAAIFKDEYMYKQLKDGRDLHTDVAISTTGKKLHPDGLIDDGDLWRELSSSEYITKTDRTKAKAVNFGFIFGMSANSFIPYAFTGYGVVYTKEEAETVRNTYFNMYKDIAKYHSYIWSNYKKPGFTVSTALGRKVKPKLGTDGINVPIQGSGAETTKLAVHYLVKDYGDIALKYIYNVVHDAIYLRVPRGDKDHWAQALNKSMLKAWEEISKTPLFYYKDVPMIADVEIYE
ncbi:MAG: hypothetical protein JHC33_11100 [Ignisphaera sp.]|nr:hypothetical protein [Ignisphaera sp.]